jgi:hypothetical protein
MPLNSAIGNEPAVEYVAVHYINSVGDEAYAEFSQLRGDLDRARTIFAEQSQVRRFELHGETEGMAYLHYESAPLLDELMGLLSDHAVVVSWPIRFIKDAQGVNLTLLGTESILNDVLSSFPDAVTVELLRTGNYTPNVADPLMMLTDQQRETLNKANRMGYYETPRETNQQELAEELGISSSALSEQLQRIEATLVDALTST